MIVSFSDKTEDKVRKASEHLCLNEVKKLPK
jgi:hypothetical protein